jgi:hypothetical protein
MEGISEKDIETMAMMLYEILTEDIWPPRSHHLRYRYIDAVESVLEYVYSILAAKAGVLK